MVHHRSGCQGYSVAMGKRPDTAETLRTNLRALMKHDDMSLDELSKKSSVSKRMISYILTGERNPTVDIAEALASVFGLPGWQLMLPRLPIDLAKNGGLNKLVSNYAMATTEGRQYIDRVAEQESKYSAL